MRNYFCKLSSVVSIFLCLALLLNTVAFAAASQPNAVVESISLYNRSGILKGETIQLEADVEASGSLFDSVEWSSSDPSVISCTEDGKIKGLVAGKAATITCKAKWGSKKASIKIYCVERLPDEVKSGFEKKIAFIYQTPNSWIKDISLDLRYYWSPFNIVFELIGEFFARISSNVITNNKVSVVGKFNNFAYIRYGENNSKDGFVKYTALKNKVDGFLNLSATQISLWADGNNYSTGILTTDYNGDVEWKVDDEDYASYDDEAGQITGKIPGKVITVTATADGMTAECKVRLLYKWPQTWVTEINKNTYLYRMKGTEFFDTQTLHTGTEFTVYGDCGTNDGWVFGCYKIGETNNWGYVPIADISTKGTISQYNKLDWFWPVNDAKETTKARYITSPYGWRDTDPAKHKGIDIANGTNSVDGYEVVSAFAGKVIYVCEDKYKSCGYCVAIRSNEKDQITGKFYVSIYMHMKYIPDVELNQKILPNQKLGYVGNTGNSKGSHLHFEVNNQNLSYGQKIYYENDSDKEMVFGSHINPMFFYMDYYNLPDDNPYKIKINPGCDAMNYRKPLWYGDDIKESKTP